MKPLDVRRAEALARNVAWNMLSPKAQLEILDHRGETAKRQRARLSAQLSSRGTQAIPAADVAQLKEALLPSDPKPAKPRHKKGKRGDGRRTP